MKIPGTNKNVFYLKYEDGPGWTGPGWYFENDQGWLVGPYDTDDEAFRALRLYQE